MDAPQFTTRPPVCTVYAVVFHIDVNADEYIVETAFMSHDEAVAYAVAQNNEPRDNDVHPMVYGTYRVTELMVF